MSYPFVSRRDMEVGRDVISGAEEVVVEGRADYNSRNERVGTGALDSDVFLTEQVHLMRMHDGKKLLVGRKMKAFVIAVQLFSDAAVVFENGGTLTVLHLVGCGYGLPSVRDA